MTEEHPRVADTLECIAFQQSNIGNPQKALKIYEKILGKKVPLSITRIHNYMRLKTSKFNIKLEHPKITRLIFNEFR